MAFYTLTQESRIIKGKTVWRIVGTGQRQGGFVESEANLSKDGECFLHGDSVSMDNAVVADDAQVYGVVWDNARIYGRAEVYGEVYGNAVVRDSAKIYGRVGGAGCRRP